MVTFCMRIQIGRSLLAVVFLVSGSTCVARAQAPVAARIAAQNALFEEIYQAQLKNSPETATAFGDYRYNDQLDDESLAAIAREDVYKRQALESFTCAMIRLIRDQVDY